MDWSHVRSAVVTSTRAAATTLLVASGVMSVAASRERWFPSCGSWDAPACVEVQDHRYDYLPPWAPWSPIGEAAHYAAVAELLLAAAVLVLPLLLFRGRPVLAAAVGVVTSVGVAVIALSTWASAEAGRPVTSPALLPALAVVALVWPVALVVLVVLRGRTPSRPGRGWRVLVLVALLVATPVPQALLAIGPYDTAPWTDASAGCLLLLAGCGLWPATAPGHETSTVREVARVRTRPTGRLSSRTSPGRGLRRHPGGRLRGKDRRHHRPAARGA